MSGFKVMAVRRHRINTDGNGITTLVGLHDCPLDCKYCLNGKMLELNKYEIKTPEQLLSDIMIDYCYFVATNGGITFGGGEPLLHSDAIKEFREILPKEVNINIETSLHVDNKVVVDIMDSVKELIIDIKTSNPEIYKKYTGKHISNTIMNLEYIASMGLQSKCTIRIPYIPEYTDEKDVEETIDFVRELGYQKLDIFKYKKIINNCREINNGV